MKRTLIEKTSRLACAIAAASALAAGPAHAGWQLIDLLPNVNANTYTHPVAISTGGSILAASSDTYHLWRGGVRYDIPQETPQLNRHLYKVSDVAAVGNIYLKSTGTEQAIVHDGTAQTVLPCTSTTFCRAVAVSANGAVVVGYDGGQTVLWANGVKTTVGTLSLTNSVNAQGQVAAMGTNGHAVLREASGVIVDIGVLLKSPPLGSNARWVNEAGVVVGEFDTGVPAVGTPGNIQSAFAYANGTAVNIGSLVPAGYSSSYAYHVNSSGVVAGFMHLTGTSAQRGALYYSGAWADLNTVLPASQAGWTVRNALGVTNANNVVLVEARSPAGKDRAAILYYTP